MSSNEDYWKKRAEQRLISAEEKALRLETKMKKSFDLAYKQIEAEIAKLYREFGDETGLSYDAVVHRLTKRQKAQFKKDLEYYIEQIEETDPEYAKKLKAIGKKARITRLEAVKASIEAEVHKLYAKELNGELQLLFSDVLDSGYHRTLFDIQQFQGFGMSFTSLSPYPLGALLEYPWSGKNYSQKLWGHVRSMSDTLESILTTGIIQGKSNQKMASELAKATGTQYQKALTLVRTETNFMANSATGAAYDAYGVEKYKYLATLDLRTSEICRELDGQVFPLAEKAAGLNYPPMHPRCRSTTVPDLEELEGTRIARRADGTKYKVPRDMSYKEWYEKYVKTDQKELAAEKMIKNHSADKKQYQSYKATLGRNAPGRFADFQRMKYNDSDAWAEMKERYRATNYVRSDRQRKNILKGRQDKHIVGTNAYKQYAKAFEQKGQFGPSRLTISSAEAEALVKKYAGTGDLKISNGQWQRVEIIRNNTKPVGEVINNMTGESAVTTVFKIHYSSKGVHIVPDYPSKSGR